MATQEKVNPKAEVGTPPSTEEVRAQSPLSRSGEAVAEAVTPENMGGPVPRLAADIRAILRNKAVADAQAEAEAKFDAEYSEVKDADLPETLEAALAVSRDPVAEGDLRDLPGFRAATPTAQQEFERVLMRPGTLVTGTEDVYDAADLKEKKTLYEGERVPEASHGFVSAHFISEVARQRILAGR